MLNIRFRFLPKLQIACRPRRLPTRWKVEVEDEVRRLRRDGLIQPSTSGYAAPICPVSKSDGSLRLCVDYRQLNGKTKDTAIPTGNLQEVIESLSAAKYFSILDLARGYFQVPIVEKDKKRQRSGHLQVCMNSTECPLD